MSRRHAKLSATRELPHKVIAGSIAARLEELSCRPPADVRSAIRDGRALLRRLSYICGSRAELRPALLRGKLAVHSLEHLRLNPRRATEAGRNRTASERSAVAAQHLYASSQKERVITILREAAKTANPSAFAPQITQCEEIWLELGSAGKDDRRLSSAYQDAAAFYWQAAAGHQTNPKLRLIRDNACTKSTEPKLLERHGMFAALRRIWTFARALAKGRASGLAKNPQLAARRLTGRA